MSSKKKRQSPRKQAMSAESNKALLGYLNFSGGEPNTGFQTAYNELAAELQGKWSPDTFRDRLLTDLAKTAKDDAAFSDVSQASAVIRLVYDECLPAYRRHHRDLLAHLTDDDFLQPFFVVRVFEAVLSQEPPWEETERIVGGAIDRLNDFIGFRPVAVLENERQMEPYPHERTRPMPIYLKDVGAAVGPYRELIEHSIAFFEDTPAEIQHDSYFDLSRMDELAVDVRAHDHLHPVNKRTNYLFGEWDPHVIDSKGFYRRFVLRKIILDALVNWIDEEGRRKKGKANAAELLYDASAVLCGTMLMASAISGYGPEMHDSNVTLSSLLPKVARQRDAFYERLMQLATGKRKARLNKEAQQTQQPFGHVRQRLNIALAQYGAQQMETRHLAQLFAQMGYTDEARRHAMSIPCPAARFECEIQCRLSSAQQHTGRRELTEASRALVEVEDLLHRGIECGAIIDPWNILGFQGQFPLFSSREDALYDLRAEMIIEIMERIFRGYGDVLIEAAAEGNIALRDDLRARMTKLAAWWDQFATPTVQDLPKVLGQESVDSAWHVADVLSEWKLAGEGAGDIKFWRQHVERFQSGKAYAVVVDALLNRGDLVASQGLMMQWLSQAEAGEVEYDAQPYAIYMRLMRWLEDLVATEGNRVIGTDKFAAIAKMFEYVEVNAGDLWHCPNVDAALGTASPLVDDPFDSDDDLDPFDDEDEDDEDNLFGAAYDQMVFKDSADDGQFGELMDTGGDTTSEFELLLRELEPRLHFLELIAEMWQLAAGEISQGPPLTESQAQRVAGWRDHATGLKKRLSSMIQQIWDSDVELPSGDHDSNVEFDERLQTKYYMLQLSIGTATQCLSAERCLEGCLPASHAGSASKPQALIAGMYRDVLAGNVGAIRARLPMLLRYLGRQPLLYIPLTHNGEPQDIQQAQAHQAVIRFLLHHLPKLGLLVETWRVLYTAYRMERTSRPGGQAVTEFDQLFKIALRNSVDCLAHASKGWRFSPKLSPQLRQRMKRRRSLQKKTARRRKETVRMPQRRDLRRGAKLVEMVAKVVERYTGIWLKHSRTTRLSTVENLLDDTLWKEVQAFVREYGADLFHARMMTLGNLRAILHYGVDNFLDHLEEDSDPLHPMQLIDDIEDGLIDRGQAEEYIELIYGSVVDRMDRFVEYNTTTTQSDYGEQFYCLLDFLRAESKYERDSWNLSPFVTAHEQLAKAQAFAAAETWEQLFAAKNKKRAAGHVSRLTRLEKKYGMHLPALKDRIHERFVKPLAVNRMLALVPRAVHDVFESRGGEAFEMLAAEIENYLKDTSGSGVDVPPWLRTLEHEVRQALPQVVFGTQTVARTAKPTLSLRRLQRQLGEWPAPSNEKLPLA